MIYRLKTREQRPECAIVPTGDEEGITEDGVLEPSLAPHSRCYGRHLVVLERLMTFLHVLF